MAPVRRLVLDLLKPHDPDIVRITRHVADCDGVSGVNAALVETDRDVQTLKLTVVGDDVPERVVYETIEELGASVHSVDEVVCGEVLVEQTATPQD
ncbi:hypothetical protein SAMN04487949_0795 [Halogranum gelatinilyticum]|uniref:DUF211 domain-containing protein n=1 Tax=Halogranum gelatinilyticum TaxID=660521 RepID=A0A1G9QEI8_9EURY|nr:DUF211 domain-containing protein [Halogranum gelatinilyticum]SDM08735.1 hypothetical protein SAMN04487949_0795 [Halogranum gelatinilyticum]